MVIKRLRRFVNILSKRPRVTFRLPSHHDVAIYDIETASLLKNLIGDSPRAGLIPARNEEVNAGCLAEAALLKIFVRQKSLKHLYINCIIRHMKPDVFVTCLDNDRLFYSVSHDWKGKVRSIAFQNGMRRESDIRRDLLNGADRMLLYCDHILTINDFYKRLYGGIQHRSVSSIGTLLMNEYLSKRPRRRKNNSALFISQFRMGSDLVNDRFYEPERNILPLLAEWCKRNKIRLSILGGCIVDPRNEHNLYKKIIGDEHCFEFLPKSRNPLDAYSSVDGSCLTIFIDSTLGYEALRLGSRIACFPSRGAEDCDDRYLSFDRRACKQGLFWSSNLSESQIERVLNFSSKCTQDTWEAATAPIMEDLIGMDIDISWSKSLLQKG